MTSIYHTTHFDNLPGLLARGEILSDSLIQAAGLRPRSIAHGNIKHRRANTIDWQVQLSDRFIRGSFTTQAELRLAKQLGGRRSDGVGRADGRFLDT